MRRHIRQLCRGHEDMMGYVGTGNYPMVGASVAVAVAVQEAVK